MLAARSVGQEGLSPRVRGNPIRESYWPAIMGSIPACAGEPICCRLPVSSQTVYPRVCGGTPDGTPVATAAAGLSPRVRGNLMLSPFESCETRSIPACAGEPWPGSGSSCASRVYPRVCGGTNRKGRQSDNIEGLSPRVRGNRRCSMPKDIRKRSIPACAGEPDTPIGREAGQQVYPRVCGGTIGASALAAKYEGLSPRVRGNHIRTTHSVNRIRSIPACAGEPPAPSSS